MFSAFFILVSNIFICLSDINHSPDAEFIVSFSHFLFAAGGKSVVFELSTVGPTDLIRALAFHTLPWKKKELSIFSQLRDAWKLDREQVSFDFYVSPYVTPLFQTTSILIRRFLFV